MPVERAKVRWVVRGGGADRRGGGPAESGPTRSAGGGTDLLLQHQRPTAVQQGSVCLAHRAAGRDQVQFSGFYADEIDRYERIRSASQGRSTTTPPSA
jgi:hypothetical protein